MTSFPLEIVSGQDFYAGGFPLDMGGYISSLLASVWMSPLGLEYNLLRPHLADGLSVPDHIYALVGDAFAKITWKNCDRELIFLSVFGSYDSYGFSSNKTSSQAFDWSNLIGNLNWIRESASGWEWKSKLSHNVFHSFQNQTQKINSNRIRMFLQSALMEEGLLVKVSKGLNARLRIQTGADAYISFFLPGVSKVYQRNELAATAGKSLITDCGPLHGQIGYNIGPFYTTAGLRVTVFFSGDYKTVKPIADLLVSYELTPSPSAVSTRE